MQPDIMHRRRAHALPLWEAPKTWLQLLMKEPELVELSTLQRFMSVSWAMCAALLRCMHKWRLTVQVGQLADAVKPSCTLIEHSSH
jgi:hypothetical protein